MTAEVLGVVVGFATWLEARKEANDDAVKEWKVVDVRVERAREYSRLSIVYDSTIPYGIMLTLKYSVC